MVQEDQSIQYPVTIGVEDGFRHLAKKMLVRERHGISVPSSGPGFNTQLQACWESAHKEIWHEQQCEKVSLGMKMPRMSHRHPMYWVPSSVTFIPYISDGSRLPTESELISERCSGRLLQGASSETFTQLAGANTNSQQLHDLECFWLLFC